MYRESRLEMENHMVIRPQYVSGSCELPSGQVTPAELRELVADASDDMLSLHYSAHWKSGDKARGWADQELPNIEDFQDLEYLRLDFDYPEYESLTLTLQFGQLDLRWSGAVAADRARRVDYRWRSFPRRSRITGPAAHGLRVAPVPATFFALTLAFANLHSHSWVSAVAFAAAITFVIVIAGGRRLFTGLRAERWPFVETWPATWWHDAKFVITTSVALIAALAAVLQAIITSANVG
jgi:hypothetical protein